MMIFFTFLEKCMYVCSLYMFIYIAAAQAGTFIPDREKDELTEALGNPEHPG
jgi:hypothetical protein